MNRKRRLIIKYLLLISVLMLMMLLCACRVRLTNNTEVASTIEDEDGWLKDSYQMRRDQLGEPVAERPIFRGLESDDEEDYSDLDYEPLDYDQGTLDEWDEPEDTSSSSSSSSGGSSGRGSGSSSGSGSGSGSDSSEEESTPKEEEKPKPEPVIEIIVELDVNGGNPIDPSYIKAVTGQTYRNLPGEDTLTHPDKNQFCTGWFTEQSGGSRITAETTVESEEPLTLYAHWGTNYTFILKPDGGLIDNKPGDVQMSSDKGLYHDLPVPVKTGFHFMGWYVKNGGTESKVDNNMECTSSQELTAHWEKVDVYWDNRYSVASNNEAFTDTFTADDASIAKGKAPAEGEKPGFRIVKCVGEYNKANADTVQTNEAGKYTKSLLVVPANTYDNDNNKRLYRLILLRQMYGDTSTISDDEIRQAASELGITLAEPPVFRFDAEQAQ